MITIKKKILFLINNYFYFFSTILTICYYNIINNELYKWSQLNSKYFSIKYKIYGKNKLYENGNCIYLTNHRTQSDFFIDIFLTNGRCIIISRLLVIIYAFFYIPIYLFSKALFIINRNKNNNKCDLFIKLDKFLKNNKRKCILVYPEGKRNLNNYSLKLKKGFLLYSYEKKIPIQIFITKNKERVYNEKKIESEFNVELKTKYSELINPNNFNNFNDYFIEINNKWDNLWNDIYNNNNNTDEYVYKNLNDNSYYKINNSIFFKIIFLLSNFLILYIYLTLCYYYKIFIIHPLLVVLN